VFQRVDEAPRSIVGAAGVMLSPFTVRASFVELYREDVRDLLRPETPSKVTLRTSAARTALLSL
jgi:hypothetical protein